MVIIGILGLRIVLLPVAGVDQDLYLPIISHHIHRRIGTPRYICCTRHCLSYQCLHGISNFHGLYTTGRLLESEQTGE